MDNFIAGLDSFYQHLFEEELDLDKYVFSKLAPLELAEGLPLSLPKVRLGASEKEILSKLMNPSDPMLCVYAPLGSGKSTAISKIISLHRQALENAGIDIRDGALIVEVDFLREVRGMSDLNKNPNKKASKKAKNTLFDAISSTIAARLRGKLDQEFEFDLFWNWLFGEYANQTSPVDKVVRLLDKSGKLQREYKELGKLDSAEREYRIEHFNRIANGNHSWELHYLCFLAEFWWSKVCESHSDDTSWSMRKDRPIIVLDNVDSLPPAFQFELINFVYSAASRKGPLFLIAVRPETFFRNGLGDSLTDKVKHVGPTPSDVMFSHLREFINNPDKYKDSGLSERDFEVVKAFLNKLQKAMKTKSDNTFSNFLEASSGRSIRSAFIVAQGLIFLPKEEFLSARFDQHALVRSCIRYGKPSSERGMNSPVENLFAVHSANNGNLMTIKPRILHYIHNTLKKSTGSHDNDSNVLLSSLRLIFTAYGYEVEHIKSAIDQMLRHECQLLRTNGWDVLRENWGDEIEHIFLTQRGISYFNSLMNDIDYIEEMLSNGKAHITLVDKMDMIRLFASEFYDQDRKEMSDFLTKQGRDKYVDNFGSEFLSLQLVRGVYGKFNAIANASIRNSRSSGSIRQEYERVNSDLFSVVQEVEEAHWNMLGINLARTEMKPIR